MVCSCCGTPNKTKTSCSCSGRVTDYTHTCLRFHSPCSAAPAAAASASLQSPSAVRQKLQFEAHADQANNRVELQSTQVELEVSRNNERALQSQLDQLKQVDSNRSKMNEDLKHQIGLLQIRNRELEGRLDQLRGKHAAQEQGLGQTSVSLKHEIRLLQAQNSELIEQLDELQDSHEALQVSFQEQEQNNDALNHEMGLLRKSALEVQAVNESLDRWRSAFFVVVLGLALHWLLVARPDVARVLTPLLDSDTAPRATALLNQVNRSMSCNISDTPPVVNSTVLHSACQCPPISLYDVAPHIGLFIGALVALLACVKFGKRVLHLVSSAAPSYLAQSIPIDVSLLLPFEVDDFVPAMQLEELEVDRVDRVEAPAIEPLPELQSDVDVDADYDDCEHSIVSEHAGACVDDTEIEQLDSNSHVQTV